MRQSWFSWFGVLLLLVPVAFTAAFGVRATVSQSTMPLLAAAGVLALLGGRVAAVELGPVRASWRHLVGGAYLLVAAGNLLGAPGTLPEAGSTARLVLLAALLVTTGCIAFMGWDIARDGRHFEVTGDAERVVGW